MTTIFENDLIKVSATGRDYDFIAIIDNKTDGQICIHYDKPGYNDNYDPILVAPNDWVGLLADEEGKDWLKAIENNQIYVVTDDDEIGYYPTGCSMTQWNEDCEEITNQVERILNEYNLYDHDRNTNVANSNQLVTVLEILKKIK
mgnify:CR=1 FL=1